MATISKRAVKVEGRLSYPDLFTPHKSSDDAKPKYGATLLIPKTDTATIQRVQAAIQAAVKDGVDRGVFKQPIDPTATNYPPLRDGDTPNKNGEARGEEFQGCWFIAAKSTVKRKPFVVQGDLSPLIDESEIYAGAFVNMAVQFYAYESKTGGKGIAASLVGVQKVKDGDRLGGPTVEVDDVFGVINTDTAASSDDDWL